MTGIRCPKCGKKEMQPWAIGRSTGLSHNPIKICPRGHEFPLFSGRTMDLDTVLSACTF
jgi:hypothetical protein